MKIIDITKMVAFALCVVCEADDVQTMNRIYDCCTRGKFSEAERMYEELLQNTKNNKRINHEYAEFLYKMGKYQRIIELKDILKITKEREDEVKQNIAVIKTGVNKNILRLLDKSPNSFEIVYAAAVNAFEKGDRTRFYGYFNRLKSLNKDDNRVILLQARLNMADGQYQDGIRLFEKLGHQNFVEYAKLFLDKIASFNSISSGKEKAQHFVRLYNNMVPLLIKDRYKPSLYTRIAKDVLEKIVEICLNSAIVGGVAYSNKLLYSDPGNLKHVINHIRLLLVENRVREAVYLFKEKKSELPKNVRVFLTDLIERKQKEVEEEQKKQRAEEQRRREQRERRRRAQMGKSDNAGKDFKEYYKTLAIKKDAKEKEIKKAWKKAAKKAQIAMAKKERETGEKDETPLKRVNKAWEILGDPEKKELYDKGLDPENPQESANYQYQQQFNFDGFDDFDEIVSQFFGGRGGQRTFRTFSFH
ncbi:DNAJ [Enterospora canceri]|uniref:DNAJ n=1 Tax=Enterospora canceri TaxID=1081671 RepID=A0A1Y1S6Q2_9MICR|nr:DNAJ [Enterospora canceri]